MYYLNEAQQRSLLNQPETGMGYQLVELTTFAFRKVVGMAYNAEIVLERDEPEPKAFLRALALGAHLKSYGQEVRDVKLLSLSSSEFRAFLLREPRAVYAAATPGPAKDAPVVATKAGEVFKRFSAYTNDHRIEADGSLKSGTYATTEADARLVRTGKEAVARYALPNPDPAVNAFIIRPVAATAIQYGVVQPAYAQPGGGVEVLFTHATAACTVTGPNKIPPG